MQQEKIELNGKVLKARELTVNEVDTVLGELESGEMHRFEYLFPDEAVSAGAMAASLGIGKDDLLELTHSQLVALIGEVKRTNPFLVGKIELLAEMGKRLLAGDDPPQEKIPEAPAPGSGETSAG